MIRKRLKAKASFDFLSRIEKLWVSNFCLKSRGEVYVSLGPTEAGVDFGAKKFSGEISFQ